MTISDIIPRPFHRIINSVPVNSITSAANIAGKKVQICISGGWAKIYVWNGNKFEGPLRVNGDVKLIQPEYFEEVCPVWIGQED